MKSPSRQAFDKKYPQWAAELEMDEAGSISSLDSITARHSFRVWDEAWKQCANMMYGVLQDHFDNSCRIQNIDGGKCNCELGQCRKIGI